MSIEGASIADSVLVAGLCAVSTAAGRAVSSDQALEEILKALYDTGLIGAGILEFASIPALRHALGQPAALAAIEAACAARCDETDGAGDVPGDEGLVVYRVPTSEAPPACLYLQVCAPLPEAFIACVAQQVALALDRIWLAERTRELNEQAEQRIREVSTIYEIGRAIDSVEIGRLLDIITEKAARVMDAQACSLMRLNPSTGALTIAASYGLSDDVVFVSHRAVGEGIAGRVAQTGEPLLICDEREDPRLRGVALRPEIGSSMVVPMKDENGRVVGVLSIRRRRPSPDFTQGDLRLFSVFASQAALAISNKQLYDDLRRHVRELSTVADLTQAIISNLDLNKLLDTVADHIVNVVQFDRCCIFLYDRASRRFVPRIQRGYRPDGICRNSVRMGEGVVGIVAKRQMTIVESNARNALQPMRGFARALGTNAFVAVPIVSNPLRSRGQTIGVVVADNKLSGRPIQSQSLELLTTFVNQGGIAIENARLYEEWQQRYHEIERLAAQTDNILRSIAPTVVVMDPAGRVTRWNRAAEEMWGIPEREATSLSCHRLVERFGLPAQEQEFVQSWIEHARGTGQPDHRYKVTLHPKRRPEIIANMLVSPLIDRHGERHGLVLMIEDSTHEARMEAEMGRIRRLADIGQLAAKMAHEVRNPLSSIKGAAQLLRHEHEHMDGLCEFLDIIVDEVNHLSKITTDLLDFARPMRMDRQLVHIDAIAERTLQFLASYLQGHNVHVSFRPGQEVPPVERDPKQMEQVMRNIILNAAQAMPDGGDLAVTTYHNADRESVTICFCDTGVGVPPDKLNDIFQPFMTTKTKGTGLGLSIVHRIVESHHGEIEVSSRVGEGTCFSITLPLRPSVTDASAPPDGPRHPSIIVNLPDV